MKILAVVVAAMAMAGIAGCTKELASTANAEGPQGVFKVASQTDTSASEYVIDPPDELLIRAPNIKEIDGSKQVVRSDRRISLNLLGEVQVGGLTPAQAQKKLVELASKYYVNPDIKVEVTANSKFYQIFGRGVNQQKKMPYTGNDNVIKALADAGLSENAWPQQVYLVRPGRNGQPPARAVIDFKHIAETGDLSQNYAIQQDDIITVPDSPLASFNFKASQVLGPVTGAGGAATSVRAAGTR
jgi:protein involved in polysaccharide export with SLBB domain